MCFGLKRFSQTASKFVSIVYSNGVRHKQNIFIFLGLQLNIRRVKMFQTAVVDLNGICVLHRRNPQAYEGQFLNKMSNKIWSHLY
jgi:hypothetical protein